MDADRQKKRKLLPPRAWLWCPAALWRCGTRTLMLKVRIPLISNSLTIFCCYCFYQSHFKFSFSSEKGSLWYAEEEEKKGANAGNLRDAIDRLLLRVPWRFLRLSLTMTLVDIRYDRNKLAITATGTPNWIEELEDDFEDMEEDIETYRCTCKWSEIWSENTIWLEQSIVCVSCSANNRETWYCIPRLGHNEAVKGTKKALFYWESKHQATQWTHCLLLFSWTEQNYFFFFLLYLMERLIYGGCCA